MVASGLRTMIAGSLSSCIGGFHQSCRSSQHPARDARALAQGRLSLLLALEIASTGRAATNRGGAARADPANEHGEPVLGSAAHSR